MEDDIIELPLLQAQTKDIIKAHLFDKSTASRLNRMQKYKPVIAKYLKASNALRAYLRMADETNQQIKEVLNRHALKMQGEAKTIAAFYLKYAKTPLSNHKEAFQIDFAQTHKILYQRIKTEQTHLIPEYHRLKQERLNQERTQPLS